MYVLKQTYMLEAVKWLYGKSPCCGTTFFVWAGRGSSDQSINPSLMKTEPPAYLGQSRLGVDGAEALPCLNHVVDCASTKCIVGMLEDRMLEL